jgi:hypothetical protein
VSKPRLHGAQQDKKQLVTSPLPIHINETKKQNTYAAQFGSFKSYNFSFGASNRAALIDSQKSQGIPRT